MAVHHTCDRCGREIGTDKENPVHHINLRLSVLPNIEELNNDIPKDNPFNGGEYCKECSTKIIKKLIEPLAKPENLGV